MSYWPPQLPRTITAPSITLSQVLEDAAARYGNRPAIHFFGRTITYSELRREVEALAAWLTHIGVKRGDRVILYLQNSPQWVIAYFAVLRADAVVVPVNPMSRSGEFRRYAEDNGAAAAICSQELAEIATDGAPSGLREIAVACYSDYLPAQPEFVLPEWITAPATAISGCTLWSHAVSYGRPPRAPEAQPDDMAILNYTSGSGGAPKGCIHTHQTFLHSVSGLCLWHGHSADSVFLGVAPFYQIAGLVSTMNCAIFCGASLAVMPRWDRELAAQLIARYRASFLGVAPAALRDLLASPDFTNYDLSSVKRISSGGSTMPRGLFQQLYDKLHLPFIEVYGMTESGTIAINPIERPKAQCLGVPFFNTDLRIIDPNTGAPATSGSPGEFVVRGPQVFLGYWQASAQTDGEFIEIEGCRYFRTGDIGYADDEGYLFMTDRLKRMINASGYKVWPAEVESVLAQHPGVLDCCVVGVPNSIRGETVKALVIRRSEELSEADLIAWARERMAAYKYPRIVQFVEDLPKSPAGKTLWRELQERERR